MVFALLGGVQRKEELVVRDPAAAQLPLVPCFVPPALPARGVGTHDLVASVRSTQSGRNDWGDWLGLPRACHGGNSTSSRLSLLSPASHEIRPTSRRRCTHSFQAGTTSTARWWSSRDLTSSATRTTASRQATRRPLTPRGTRSPRARTRRRVKRRNWATAGPSPATPFARAHRFVSFPRFVRRLAFKQLEFVCRLACKQPACSPMQARHINTHHTSKHITHPSRRSHITQCKMPSE